MEDNPRSHHKHYTIYDRFFLFFERLLGKTYREISQLTGFSISSISKEINRNSVNGIYIPWVAQNLADERKSNCKKHKLLEKDYMLMGIIQYHIVEKHYSPEQIVGKFLKNDEICVKSIYNAIDRGDLDLPKNYKQTEIKRHLRYKGKPRHTSDKVDNRGKIPISNTIHKRPKEINNRSRIGDWEADTVLGKQGGACLLTLVYRRSKYLIATKITKKTADYVSNSLMKIFNEMPKDKLNSITPDRGKEFAKHETVSKHFNVEFYFPDPGNPGQRGTNENTNGLIREFIKKGEDIGKYTEKQIQEFVDLINERPRKCLNWETPKKIFFSKA